MRTYAEPVIGSLPVRDVTTAHVIKVLEPIWTVKTETATRVRSRMELVLDFAAARGLREGSNPARWRGNLDAALPKAGKLATVQHHSAVAVDDMGLFMERLRAMPGMGARALEFAILTAARSGEVRGATWSEIALTAALWTVPAPRMKAGREHRVPLSKPAVKLLLALPAGGPGDLVFPGLRGTLSDMSLTAVLRRMKVDATAHGFRSTFRDWCAECTNHASEVAEMALAHVVGDIVQYTISVNARQRMRAGADGLPDEYRTALAREVAAPYYQLSGPLIRARRLVEAERVVELLKDEELAGLFRGAQERSQRPPEQVPGTDAHFALARQWIASARELTR